MKLREIKTRAKNSEFTVFKAHTWVIFTYTTFFYLWHNINFYDRYTHVTVLPAKSDSDFMFVYKVIRDL